MDVVSYNIALRVRDESTWCDATRGGHDACLSYLREHGCPRGEETRDDADADADSDS